MQRVPISRPVIGILVSMHFSGHGHHSMLRKIGMRLSIDVGYGASSATCIRPALP